MRDFFEFASKYAMAIDHTEWTAVNQKTREKNGRRQGKKFKCTKFAVQTTEMPVRKMRRVLEKFKIQTAN